MKHFLTFDLEHWYLGYQHRGGYGWERFPSRDHIVVERLLDLMREYGCEATFFVTGRFTEEFASLVRRIADAGHEIASHSYDHTLVHDFPAIRTFCADLRRSLRVIEDVTGVRVQGFRAPKWSIPAEPMAFYEALLDEGLLYDSSLFPGFRAAPDTCIPHLKTLASGRAIWEFPATTYDLGLVRIPVAGGLWLRLFPAMLSRNAIRQGEADQQPRMVYLHPYDLDPDCPKLKGVLSTRSLPFMWARYYRLDSTEVILRGLLRDFQFTSLRSWLNDIRRDVPAAGGDATRRAAT